MTEQNETNEKSNEQGAFSIQKMIEDAKSVLVNPKKHFASMSLTGGMGEPVIKALIYGTVAGILHFLWGLLHLSVAGGLFMGHAVGLMLLIWSIIGAVIGLFIGAVVVLVISAICSGSTDFESNVRITADMMVLMPIGALFGFLGGISFLSTLINVVINLYALWMLYHALNEALKANQNTSKILTLVLAALMVLFLLIGMATRRAVHRISGNPDQMMEKYSKAARKLAKEYGGEEAEKAVKEAMDTQKEMASDIIFVLETPDGNKIKNPESSDISDAIKAISGDDFVIISHGDDFLQTTKSGDGYILQYKDKSGMYECKKTDFAPEIIITTFTSYLNPSTWAIWKQQFEWGPAEQ